MSIARIAETIENPSVPQLLAAYPTKDAFDTAFRAGKIKRTQESGAVANIFNRIVDDALAKQAQVKAQTTVMQDLTAPRQPMGLVAAAQPQAPQQPQMRQPVMARAGGLARIPVRDNMYDMAGGGIVAFQKGGGSRLDPRIPALMQANPGMTVSQAIKLLSRVGGATFGAGLVATDALMATDKGGLTNIAPTPGYDYGAETMTGGRPEIPVESVGTREQSPGFTDYLRAVGLAPREQAMDPATGKFVDVPAKPIFESATPGLAGVKDQTDVEKRIAAAEAGVGPDVERNSERADDAEARRQDLLKQFAEDEAKKAEERKAQAEEKPPADKKEGKKTFNDYLTEVQQGMGTSKVGDDTREEIKKDRAARKKEEQNAMWMGIVEAGLGIMGGESPYAAVNIGKGATNALKSYAARLREQKKLDREDRKILLDLEKAERAELRDNYRLASESFNKALDRMSAEERTRISAEAQKYQADKSVEAAGILRPSQAITSMTKVIEQVDSYLITDSQYRDLKKTNPAAAKAYRQQLIDSRSAEVGLSGQMPGLNLGAWGQLTTVPGAK